jgi:hypothetical protein
MVRASVEQAVQSRVDVFSPEGKLKKAALVDGMGQGDCGIGVDPAGNVYLGVGVKKKGAIMPPEFRGKVPEPNWLCWAQWTWGYRPAPWYYMVRNEYLYHLGSVMKFGPEGGAFYGRGSMSHSSRKNAAPVALLENAPEGAEPENAPEGAEPYLSSYLYREVKAVGARWRYPGMGIVPASCRLWGDPSCVCMTSRLGVDRFGRVYLPNCFGFCVDVLDTDGNRLTRLGEYGNVDDVLRIAGGGGGDGSDQSTAEIRNPKSAVYFSWPAFVDAAGGKVFVSDSVTRMITVVGFDWAAEKTVAVE